MSDQSVFGLSTARNQGHQEIPDNREAEVLRGLAGQVAELAARPIESEKRALWYAHNALHTTRPVIFCDPENGWNEIIPEDQLKCAHELSRTWEMALRKEIYWGSSMGDDRVIEPFFNIPYTYEESDWGMHDDKVGGLEGGSYTWEAPLKEYERDLPRLNFPVIRVDHKATTRNLDLAQSIFGDLLQVRIRGVWWWTLGMTWTLITLRGLESFMTDFHLFPDNLKKLMAFLRDGHLAKLDFLESENLLGLNNDGTYVGSGGFGYTTELPQKDFDGTHVRTMDMWGFGESQETVSVSPEMFEEFIFPYQLPVLDRFGLNCYGCCEPLDLRWEVIKRIPRLRRVSVSPWSDVRKMSDFLQDRYIYSRKPAPTDIAVFKPDWGTIRNELREFCRLTRNNRVEIIMKDNHTLGRNPENARTWCSIARQEAEGC